MSGWHCFEGQIVPMVWGDSVYTVLSLPAEVANALVAEGAKRVEGELEEHPVDLALTKAPVIDATFVYTGKTLLRDAGLTPGEGVDVRLRIADPDFVEIPEDVIVALRKVDKTALWEGLSSGKKRGHLHQINSAKRIETRNKRIEAIVQGLS